MGPRLLSGSPQTQDRCLVPWEVSQEASSQVLDICCNGVVIWAPESIFYEVLGLQEKWNRTTLTVQSCSFLSAQVPSWPSAHQGRAERVLCHCDLRSAKSQLTGVAMTEHSTSSPPSPTLGTETGAACAPTLLNSRAGHTSGCLLHWLKTTQRGSWFSWVLSIGGENGGLKKGKKGRKQIFCCSERAWGAGGKLPAGLASHWEVAKEAGTASPDACLPRAGDEDKLLPQFPQYIFIRPRQMAAEVTASTPSSFQPKSVRESDISITKPGITQAAPNGKWGKGDQKSCAPDFHEFSPLRENLGCVLPW